MAKRYDDDDLDYKNIRPGEIDKTIFESDDDDYEIDSTPLDEENTSDEVEDDTDYDMENATIKELIEDDEETNEEAEEPVTEVEKFDSTEEITEEEKINEEGPKLLTEYNSDKIAEISDPEPVETEQTEEVHVQETEGTVEKETENDDEEKIEEPQVDETPVEETKEEVVEENNENELPNEALVKAKEEDTELDINFRSDMVKRFKDAVKDIYTRYKEDDLVNYINDFINKDNNRKDFSDTFILNYCKFSLAIDFSNELALRDLYVLTAGLFADAIEERKRNHLIESHIENDDGKDPNNVNIIQDEYIRKQQEYNRSQAEKYKQYRIDRTIFNITNDEEESSIFDDKRVSDRDFFESAFYKIHKEVMVSDRYADMSKIFSYITINEESSYIPVIDYSTGIRVICIDTDDTDQYRLNPMLISRKVQFQFKGFNNRNIKLRVLYLDDAKARPTSVISSLKKLIGYKYYKQKYKVKLNRNYVVAYTTEPRYVDMFEKGDMDSKKPDNSPLAMSKPSNMTIGIIVLDKKTVNDKRAIRRNQIFRDLGQYQPPSQEEYNIQFVLSARIIKNDMRLRNPAIPRNERYVEYSILQYNECNPIIILDGLETIIACIIKEHKNTYAPGTPYSITFEYDRDGLVSPAVVAMLDERDGLEPALNQKIDPNVMDGMFILPPSRRKMEGTFDFEVGRIDRRYLSPIAIQRKYDKSLWSNYDISTKEGRFQFIRSRGFEEFLHNKPVIFDVMPYALNMIESSESINDIIKVSLTMLEDRNSEDSERILYKQSQLNYKKYLRESSSGDSKFKLFLFEAANYIIDSLAAKNNPTQQ